MKDLGLDSLDQVEIIMAMEDEFGKAAPRPPPCPPPPWEPPRVARGQPSRGRSWRRPFPCSASRSIGKAGFGCSPG